MVEAAAWSAEIQTIPIPVISASLSSEVVASADVLAIPRVEEAEEPVSVIYTAVRVVCRLHDELISVAAQLSVIWKA